MGPQTPGGRRETGARRGVSWPHSGMPGSNPATPEPSHPRHAWPLDVFRYVFIPVSGGDPLIIVIIVAASLLVMWMLRPKVEYLPSGNRNLVIGIVQTPPAYNLDELKDIGETVGEALRPYWDVDPDSPQAAELKYPAIADMFFVVRDRQVIIGLRAVDPARARDLIPAVFELSGRMPGSFAIAFQTSLFARGLQGQRTIDIEK